MKKVFFLTLFALSTLVGISQSQTQHLLFMNIPIDGTTENFINKLKEKDFKVTNTWGSLTRMTGSFLNSEDVIFIYSDDVTKIVYKIEVDIEKIPNIHLLYSDYKELYVTKYGKCTEEYTYSLYDWSKQIQATWILALGKITLNYHSSAIVINYVDGLNNKNHFKQSSVYKDI